MKITILCTDAGHPINEYLEDWIKINSASHEISLVRRKSELFGGDLLFLISCSEILNIAERNLYRASLVLHASDLPKGKGWSPHIWEIIEGAGHLTVTLLEADDSVDCGRIWKQLRFAVSPDLLWNEINTLLFTVEMELMNFAVINFQNVKPIEQCSNSEPSYYPRRKPEDSRIDPCKSIEEQFNIIRVCDPARFPAYFELHGHRYKLIVEKMNE